MRGVDVPVVLSGRRVGRTLAVVAVVLAALSVLGQLWQVSLGGGLLYGVIPLLNVDVEGSLSTLFHAAMLVAVAGLAATCGAAARRAGEPRAGIWFLVALAFAYLVVDEATQVHEILILPMNRLLGTAEILVWLWLVPVLPLVAMFGLLVWPFVRGLEPLTRRALVAAAGLYLGGAVVMELVNGWAAARIGTFTVAYRVVLVTVEESLEAAGLIVAIVGLLGHLARRGAIVQVEARSAP